MDQIIGCFKPGVKITVIVRTPGFDERDFLMTDDELPEVTRAIERRAAAPTTGEPVPAPPVRETACPTCGGRGEIGGWDSGENAWRTESCPECSKF